MAKLFFLLLSLVVADAYDHKALLNSNGAYPAEYPVEPGTNGVADFSFEHEKQNLTGDPDTDNGGYRYFGYYKQDLNDWPYEDYGGYCFFCSGRVVLKYLFMNQYKMDYPTMAFFNCSVIQQASWFTGVLNGEQVACGSSGCCSGLNGVHRKNSDFDKNLDSFGTDVSAGLCEVPHEVVYCQRVSGNTNKNCYQSFSSPLGRRIPLFACYDFMFKYWSSCPVYKKSGKAVGFNTEPGSYISKLTPADKSLSQAFFENPDRLCIPTTYYYPEETAEDGDNGSPASLACYTLSLFAYLLSSK